ncbi:Hint domain-containing protein [Tropicibacter naphthalenivorans]|uniref:Cyclolysin n=1 Tax=Tropicibacter naphthalenivorans TaxID=441103 RepID=A0A0P1GF23_9RHOB|nr:Hint domain-containing protein [Tropicibacter naphthalenivorans]CUH80039.1 Cyclolysin [Tropicibacter naphthalenivorans]SMC83669.1 intein N-terminal splicing region [Tropicibacter naphthalenivorans]
MPNGYLVTLGDGNLDPNDVISGGVIFFDTQQVLGNGTWEWSGTWSGQTFTNEQEPGSYQLGTDGNVYFVPDFGTVDTLTSATVISAPAYAVPPDGFVDGTAGADVINPGYVDNTNDTVDGTGADNIRAGGGDDTVTAGEGSDTVDGGDGNDLIYGDYGNYDPAPIAGDLNWNLQGPDNANLAGGFTQDTGAIDVTFGFTDDGNPADGTDASTAEVDTATANYAAGGYNPNSSLFLYGQGAGDTSTATLSFAASAGSDVADEVTNVNFRINDIDWGAGNHTDLVTVNAYDADGNPVTVTLTPAGGDTVSGNTITANEVENATNDADGSVLVQIAGPVSSIEIIYANLQANTQGIWITDVAFEATPIAFGDDSLLGGAGDDTIFGEAGNDTLLGGDGADSLNGGSGDDILDGNGGDDTLEGGAGADTLRGDSGMDYASYAGSDAGVTVNLSNGTFSGGDATGDVNGGGLDGIIGSDYNDSLTGYDAQGPDWTNDIYGGLGDDTIDGMGGDDSLYGEEGNDSIIAGWGNDYVEGGVGDDTIQGDDGNDTLLGGDGNDSIDGGTGSDTLEGGAGDDILVGGTGPDSLVGGAGNDTIYASAGDTINGGDGDDVITLVDLAEGPGTITIEGSTLSQTSGDTLDLNGLGDRTTLTYTENNGELTGSITLFDGTVVNFSNIDGVICFTPGTRILTDTGYRPIEDLRPGDLIMTRDDGPQPLRWKGERTVLARGKSAPIRIRRGALPGGQRDLLVSPQHRMVLDGYQTELMFGEAEVFAHATHMVNGYDIIREEGQLVTYIHLLLDRHQVIFAEGMATESFFVGTEALRSLSATARADLFETCPHLADDPTVFGDTARLCLKKHETQMLMAQMAEAIPMAA